MAWLTKSKFYPFLSILLPAGLAQRPSDGPGAIDSRMPICSCLALLAACGWLFSVGMLWAAETPGSTSVATSETVFEVKQDLLMTESVKTEPEVLRLLIWEGHAPEIWIERFEKQIENRHGRPVKFKISYVKGGEEFYDAIRDRAVDVVMMTHHAYKDERFKYIQNQLLLPIDLENIPNFKHAIPAIRMAEYLSSEGQVYAVPVSQGPYGLAYNTALLESEPQSWNIFWDSRFNRQYVLGANEYIYNINITALALGYSRDQIGSYDALNNPEFKKKLRSLVVNAHSFWIGVDKPDNLAGRPLAVSWGDSLGPLKAHGEQWKIAEPVEGTMCWVDNYAITWSLQNKPFLKKVAEEYINELLTTDYQVGQILRYMSLTPVITNIGELLTLEEAGRLKLKSPNFFERNRILQKTYSHRDRNGMKLLWDEATRGIALDGYTDEK
ncbi:MAG: extracellular solute-binding protein [Pseudomonadota bacterium]